jgi:agmatine/peptidylarginine deiminase
VEALLDMQMTIVRKSAPFGPVMVLADDAVTKMVVADSCARWDLCDWLETGKVQVKVVTHQGPWIRDYGPQIEIGTNGPRVVHWRYYDTRQDEALLAKRSKLAEVRLQLIEDAFAGLNGKGGTLSELLTDEDQQATQDRKLNLLTQMDSIYANAAVLQRNVDEHSAYDIAQAVLKNPRFEYVSSGAFVDGGNLMRLGDGRCLTTRTLLSRNKDQNPGVDQELVAKGPCSQVIYLEPLPGPVIEHVDMFILPAGPKKVLLASFDLRQSYVERYWADLAPEEKVLAGEAAVAMRTNARRLREAGYEVIEAPSPLPRDDGEGGVYFPTVLNALVRSNAAGKTQVLAPVYGGYEEDVQAAALQAIRVAFGPEAEIVTIEATTAAKGQGAVHCLTLTVPLAASVFADSAMESDSRLQTARRMELEKALERSLQPPDLTGMWAYVEEHDAFRRAAAAASRMIFEFKGQEVVADLGNGEDPVEGKYQIVGKDGSTWAVKMVFGDKDLDVELTWLDPDHVRIALDWIDEPHVLVRVKAPASGKG